MMKLTQVLLLNPKEFGPVLMTFTSFHHCGSKRVEVQIYLVFKREKVN
jgi:hypothetical protein